MKDTAIKITSAEFSADSVSMLIGTNVGKLKIYTLGDLESEPTEVHVAQGSINSIIRVQEQDDQYVLLVNNQEIHFFNGKTKESKQVSLDSSAFEGSKICNVYVSSNGKFMVIGIPEKLRSALGFFELNFQTTTVKNLYWNTKVSCAPTPSCLLAPIQRVLL